MAELIQTQVGMLEIEDTQNTEAVHTYNDGVVGNNIPATGQVIINEIKNDFQEIKGFITSRLIDLTKSGNLDFQEALCSLLNADPDAENNIGRAVISLLATYKSALNKIEKMSAKHEITNIDADNFKQEISELYNKAINNFSDNESIQQLINERLKNTIFETMPIFEKDQDGNPISLSSEIKKSLISSLKTNIVLSQDIQLNLLRDDYLLKTVQSRVNEKVAEKFSVEKGLINKNWFTIDQNQLSKNNLTEFSNVINEIIIESNNELLKEKNTLANSVIKSFGEIYNGKELKKHLLTVDNLNLEKLKQELEKINNPTNWEKVRYSVKGAKYVQEEKQAALTKYSAIKDDSGDTLTAIAKFFTSLPAKTFIAVNEVETIESIKWTSTLDLSEEKQENKTYTWAKTVTNSFMSMGKYFFGNPLARKLINITKGNISRL